MKVFITGSNGFIGGRIAELAGQRSGIDPVCGYRQSKGVVRIARIPLELSFCDISSKQSLRKSVESDVDVLIHCASGAQGTLAQGCQNVAEIAAEKKVKKLIFLSSVDIYGAQEGELNEENERARTKHWYNNEKIDSELFLESAAGGIEEIIVLRPTIVYGPFCVPWLIRYFDRVSAGSGLTVPEEFNGNCNLVYVDDLANLILDFASAEQLGGYRVFNVNGPDKIKWNDYFQQLETIFLEGKNRKETRQDGFVSSAVRRAAKFGLRNFRPQINWVRLNMPYAKTAFGKIETGLRKNFDEIEANVYKAHADYLSGKAQLEINYMPKFNLGDGILLCEDYMKFYHSKWR